MRATKARAGNGRGPGEPGNRAASSGSRFEQPRTAGGRRPRWAAPARRPVSHRQGGPNSKRGRGLRGETRVSRGAGLCCCSSSRSPASIPRSSQPAAFNNRITLRAHGRRSDVRGPGAGAAHQARRDRRDTHLLDARRLLRAGRRPMARRSRAVLHRGRHAGRHAGRRDPQAPAQSRHRRLRGESRRHQRRRRRLAHAHAERSAARAPLRVAARSRAQRRHPRPSQFRIEAHRDAAEADARPARRGAGQRRERSAACGPATSAATWTRPTRAKARRSTCRSSTTARLLLRRRARAAGRRRDLRLGPRNDDGRHASSST